jgi:hypothetical protein
MVYRSRKDFIYDDDESQEEEPETPRKSQIKSLLNLGKDPNAFLKANPKFRNYK